MTTTSWMDEKHECRVCGEMTYCVAQETNPDGSKTYLCDPDLQEIQEQEDIEMREFFLNAAQRKIVAQALQVAAYHERRSEQFERLMALSDYLDPQS